ncbi:hypothetical protein BH18ACI1_BH18ACI1_06520 [soil metagenome]
MVDDDSDGLLPLQLLLELHQADVICANSASAALEKIAAEKFDLLVSDIGMPEIDGYELLAKVCEISPDLLAIALTAYASLEDRELALSAGYQIHLSKPIDFDRFLAAINNLINK